MIKNTTLIVLVLLAPCFGKDRFATTDEGERVVLREDGTYSIENPVPTTESKIVREVRRVSEKATKIIKGKTPFYSVRYDESLWRASLNKDESSDAEITFVSRDKRVYAMILPEDLEVETSALKDIAFDLPPISARFQ